MKKQQLHPFVSMAGCSSEAEFHNKYPTEEHFFQKFPQARAVTDGVMEYGGPNGSYLGDIGSYAPTPHYVDGGSYTFIDDRSPAHSQPVGKYWDGTKYVTVSKGSTMNGASWSQYGGPVDNDGDVDSMKHGGIKINPANKGKFNATKTATGKTTEELTHSSNPVTKKRAVFAQNAAKWHHQYGGHTGLRKFVDGGDTDPNSTDHGDPNAYNRQGYYTGSQYQDQGSAFDLSANNSGAFAAQNTNSAETMQTVNQPVAQANQNAIQINDPNKPIVSPDSPVGPGVNPNYAAPDYSNPKQHRQRTQPWGTGFNNLLGAGLSAASFYEDRREQRNQAAMNRQMGETNTAFAGTKGMATGTHGDYGVNNGVFRPDQMTPTHAGMFLPAAKFGGANPVSGPNAGSYNTLDTRWNPDTYQAMAGVNPDPSPYAKVGKTLPEAKPGTGDLVWEKNEKMLATVGGMLALFNANAGSHASGDDKEVEVPGTETDKQTPAFVFSDTPSLKIKDKEVLKSFGATKPSTPAKLATPFDLQKFTRILADPTQDPVSKKTAEIMVKNYTTKLSQLANYQEQMKAAMGKSNDTQPQMGMAKYGGVPQYGPGGQKDNTPLSPEEVSYFDNIRKTQPELFNEQYNQGRSGANLQGSGSSKLWGPGYRNVKMAADRVVPNLQTSGPTEIPTGQTGPDQMSVFNTPSLPGVVTPTDMDTPQVGNNLASSGPKDPVKAKTPPFAYTTPDKNELLWDYSKWANVHRTPVVRDVNQAVIPQTVFVDPTRALAAHQEAANAAGYNASISGNSRTARANQMAYQDPSGVTDILGKYQNENVGIANPANREATAITNDLLNRNTNSRRQYMEDTNASDRQYRRDFNEAGNKAIQKGTEAWQNRQGYDLLNKTSPYFYVDPRSGARGFKDGNAEARLNSDLQRMSQGSGVTGSDSKNIAEGAKQYMADAAAAGVTITPEEAWKKSFQTHTERTRVSSDINNPFAGKVSKSYSEERPQKFGGAVNHRFGGMTNHQLKKFINGGAVK